MAANKQKMKNAGRNMERGARQKAHTASLRAHRIKVAREHHLANALRSCGADFAANLEQHYRSLGYSEVPAKAGKRS